MRHLPLSLLRLWLPVVLLSSLLLVAACGSAGNAGWTYAPLGPTAPPSPSGEPSAEPTPGGSPGLALDTVTPPDQALAFVPNVLEAPAATEVQVTYLNDSALPHNNNFFAGTDATAESIGATEIVTGPGAPESVSFTTPEEPGSYYFWCDVHGDAMSGTLNVAP
jgi:plastocyanin